MGVSRLLAAVLANRPTDRPPEARFRTVAAASAFLRRELPDEPGRPHDPFRLDDMDRAVTRLLRAIRRRESVCVYGDYDVDGLTATALLCRALGRAGCTRLTPYVPDRVREGYGLNGPALRRLKEEGVDLVVTVDCGVTALEEAALARSLGLDLVITDHHEPGRRLPDAVAVVDPRREGSGYPFSGLAGVGVALKLAQALELALAEGRAREAAEARAAMTAGPTRRPGPRSRDWGPLFEQAGLGAGLPDEANRSGGMSPAVTEGLDLWRDQLDLVALGTVADIVPLVEENRYLAARGLELLNPPRRVGLAALTRAAGLEGRPLTAYHLGFQLGPRLNAAGRLGDATRALRLLLTEDGAEAEALAAELDQGNRQRQAYEDEVFGEILERVEREVDLERDRAIVLAGEGWHEGVIGIVASRLVERFARPALLVAVNAEAGVGRGSGRSIPPFDLVGALEECAAQPGSSGLGRFGGHRMAAGFEVEVGALADFVSRFLDLARERLGREDLVHELRIDACVEPGDLPNLGRLATELESLEPFGTANPEPVLAMTGVRFASVRPVGGGRHLKAVVLAWKHSFDAIGFGMGELAGELVVGHVPYDIAFRPELNDWKGQTRTEFRLLDVRRAGAGAQGRA